MRHADPDLVVARVGCLVAEEDNIEHPALGLVRADHIDDRRGCCLRVPLLTLRDEMNRAVDPERHSVAKLLLRFRRTQRKDDRLAAIRLDEANGLLHPALLVRTDREAEVAGVDCLPVVRQDDPAAGHRHPLHAREDLHERILEFSGSKIGREPTTSTVTG
jgi:hypothetical protein